MVEAQKKERRQGRSKNPDQGAQSNSTWSTPPFGSVAKHCLDCSRAFRPRLVVFLEAGLDASRQIKLCLQPSSGHK